MSIYWPQVISGSGKMGPSHLCLPFPSVDLWTVIIKVSIVMHYPYTCLNVRSRTFILLGPSLLSGEIYKISIRLSFSISLSPTNNSAAHETISHDRLIGLHCTSWLEDFNSLILGCVNQWCVPRVILRLLGQATWIYMLHVRKAPLARTSCTTQFFIICYFRCISVIVFFYFI